MRGIGEKRLSSIPNTKISREFRKTIRKHNKKNILVKCSKCDYTSMLSENFLRRLGSKPSVCGKCREEGKDEMQEALIALAKRKGLLKKK